MPFESQSRTRQQLLFEPSDQLPGATLPVTSNGDDVRVADQIIEDRERLIRESGTAEPRFQLGAARSSLERAARSSSREVPDRLTVTLKASYEARIKAARARLDSRPLLAFFDAAPAEPTEH